MSIGRYFFQRNISIFCKLENFDDIFIDLKNGLVKLKNIAKTKASNSLVQNL